MKELMQRVWGAVARLPWLLVAISWGVSTLILVFLVEGELFWTDYLVAYLFSGALVVFAWWQTKK